MNLQAQTVNHQIQLTHFIQFCENLTLDKTGEFAELYTADAYFKDPFNEVKGHEAIIAIFNHMFSQVDAPRFRVTHSILQDDEAFLVWDFLFRFKGSKGTGECIHGGSHLRFTPDGKVSYHRDYWDAAEELYEKIPLLGGLMRLIKKMARR
jgi:steroid delta-isomerase